MDQRARRGGLGSRLAADWRDPAYLAGGSVRQRRALTGLTELGILRDLARFEATLIGTVPIGVDRPDSDLDIACRVGDPADFEAELGRLYASMSGFELRAADVQLPAPGRAIVAGFCRGGERYEVFGQELAVDLQAGFRHMVVEARLLELGGQRLADRVRRLRGGGAATEPAFAAALGLSGDPYRRLFDLFDAADGELATLLAGAGLASDDS